MGICIILTCFGMVGRQNANPSSRLQLRARWFQSSISCSFYTMHYWLGICTKSASLMQFLMRRVMLTSMNLTLAHIGARPRAKDEFEALTTLYLGRCSTF